MICPICLGQCASSAQDYLHDLSGMKCITLYNKLHKMLNVARMMGPWWLALCVMNTVGSFWVSMECCRHILAEFLYLLWSCNLDDKNSDLLCRRHFVAPKTFVLYPCRQQVGPLFWPTQAIFWPKTDWTCILAEIRFCHLLLPNPLGQYIAFPHCYNAMQL